MIQFPNTIGGSHEPQNFHTYNTVLSYIVNYLDSARNKDQKLIGRFSEDRIFYRLLIAIPLKVYRKFG